MENVITISNCEFIKTLYDNYGFTLALYKAHDPIDKPDGKKERLLTVKGINLPVYKGLRYDFTGKFEKYKEKWSFVADQVTEIAPSNRDAALAYLLTIKGVGKKKANDLLAAFGTSVFDVMEREPEKLYSLKGFTKKATDKILLDYSKRKLARKLFQFLYKYRVKDAKIMYINKKLGYDALEQIQEDPFVLYAIGGVGYTTAEAIAKDLDFPNDFRSKRKAAMLEVLKQAEYGGELFSTRTNFPQFMYEAFLPEGLYNLLLNKEELLKTSGTYLPEGICYLMLLKLLRYPVTFAEFRSLAKELTDDEWIFPRNLNGEVIYYRWQTAKAEFQSAKKIAELMYLSSQTTQLANEKRTEDISKALGIVEKKLQMKLSCEQEEAVKMALMNKVSVITGGPGTGKTSVEKGIIEAHRIMHPREGILLIAPTGRAAKRMSESTGAPASTIHKALSLIPSEDDGITYCSDVTPLPETLILVDEASMIGSYLLNSLLQRVSTKSRIVFIGDVDQLPSIEIGSVLKEMIASEVPVVKLTQTFRQASGSNIIVNAARINIGEKRLIYAEDFDFVEASSSQAAQDAIVDLFLEAHKTYDDDDIVVLSPYRKNTETGTNQLNLRLRQVMRPELETQPIPSFKANGIDFYEGDKVMYTRNSEELTNGDIGKITSVISTSDGKVVKCSFNGAEVELSDDELLYLDLAYALTVHKSQGSEYKMVISVCDSHHKILLKRNLIYTAITRAKQKVVIVGDKKALSYAIDSVDSNTRRTLLAYAINNYLMQYKSKYSAKRRK